MRMKMKINREKVLIVGLEGVVLRKHRFNEPVGYYNIRINWKVLESIKNYEPDLVHIISNTTVLIDGTTNDNFFHNQLQWLSSVIAEYCHCECTFDFINPMHYEDNKCLPNPGMINNVLLANSNKSANYLIVHDNKTDSKLKLAADYAHVNAISKMKFIQCYSEKL